MHQQHKPSRMNDLKLHCRQLQTAVETQHNCTLLYTLYTLTMLCKVLQLVYSRSKQRQQVLFTKQNSDVKTLLQLFKQSIGVPICSTLRPGADGARSSDAWPAAPTNCVHHRRTSLPCRRTNHKTNNITVGRRR